MNAKRITARLQQQRKRIDQHRQILARVAPRLLRHYRETPRGFRLQMARQRYVVKYIHASGYLVHCDGVGSQVYGVER